jgi:hypothetical protein
MVLADDDLDRAREIASEIGDDSSHPTKRIDASDAGAVEGLARKYDVDLVLNAVRGVPGGRQPGRGDGVDRRGHLAGQWCDVGRVVRP